MGLTPAQIQDIRDAESHLDAVTVAALLEFLGRMDMTDRALLLQAAMDVVPELVSQMGAVSSAIAVDAYDLSRAQSAAAGTYAAQAVESVLRRQVQAMVGYSLNPATTAVRDLDTGQITQRLSAGTQRLVRANGRETTVANVDFDPEPRMRWARVPRPGACGFCVLLSSRGAVYGSQASASTSSGARLRRTTRRGRTGSGQKAGSAFHDNCRCTMVAQLSTEPKAPELQAIVSQFGDLTKGMNAKDSLRAWNRYIDAANRAA